MKQILLVLALCVVGLRAAGTGHSVYGYNRATGRAYKRFSYRFTSQYNATKEKKLGKCTMAPRWSINGTYPVIDEVQKGNAVFLYTMRKSCKKCWFEVRGLHEWAKYYANIEAKAKIIVLMSNDEAQYASRVYRFAYPYLTFYNEPKGQDIFKKLKAGVYHMIMYDQCGRLQYHYKYPYSSLVKPYERLAMTNVITHWESLGCGKCEAKAEYPSPDDEDFEEIAPTEAPSDSQGPSLD